MEQIEWDGYVHSDELIELARELIRTPSLSGEEADAAQVLARWLRELGLEDVCVDEKNNVLAWVHGSDGVTELMLNGHLDHAHPGTMADPYSAALVDGSRWGEEGDCMYGRGAVDMKGALSAMACGLAAVRWAGITLRRSVVFLANTFEEVSTGEGIHWALREQRVRARRAVNGEATNLAISLGHRGMMEVIVAVKGRTSHASNPSKGINAIYKMQGFLETLRRDYTVPRGHFLGDCTFAPIDITASPGRWAPIVPDRCLLHVDRRFLPEETPEKVKAEFDELIERTRARDPEFDAEVFIDRVFPALYCDPSEPLVASLRAARKKVLGDEGSLTRWLFGVDGAYLTQYGIPCAGFGPGNEVWAHTPEDHVAVAGLLKAAKVYAQLVVELCA